MTFVARSGNHAIVEVVFGLQLSRPWRHDEIEKLSRNHERWKEKLPRLVRHEVQQVMIGKAFPQAIPLPGGPGISFERIQPNGEPSWSLRCEGSAMLVNCMEYSRWEDIWETASQYIRMALKTVGTETIPVAKTLLQYIDVFDWQGDQGKYDVFQVLDQGSRHVPESIGDHGLIWHLYQGWFTAAKTPLPGHILQKVHFDALPKGNRKAPTVRLDTVLRFDFNKPISSGDFLQSDSDIERSFRFMHDKNKELLSKFLTEKICKKIGLEK